MRESRLTRFLRERAKDDSQGLLGFLRTINKKWTVTHDENDDKARYVMLAALAPRPGELLWDVGAGSGSIAIEWCRSGTGCHAVAFERDEQRRKRITENAVAFGARVEVHFDAPEAFDSVAPPAAIFIGGGLTQPGLLEASFDRLPIGGRLIANAVTVESETLLAQWYSRHGGELQRFEHQRGEPLGGFTGWRPSMPITQWSVAKR